MRRYWDMTEKQRSELSNEQVTALLTVELMEKGVVKVEPPVLRDVQKPTLAKDTWYKVHASGGKYSHEQAFDCIFKTIESAKAFIELAPKRGDYEYEIGSEYTCAYPVSEYKIVPVELCRHEDTINMRSILSKLKADADANSKAMDVYRKECKAIEEATGGVWTDYYECRNKASDAQRVIDVYNGYVKTCDGNTAIAARFLAKAFPQGKIEESFAWFDMEVPSDTFVIVAEPAMAE